MLVILQAELKLFQADGWQGHVETQRIARINEPRVSWLRVVIDRLIDDSAGPAGGLRQVDRVVALKICLPRETSRLNGGGLNGEAAAVGRAVGIEPGFPAEIAETLERAQIFVSCRRGPDIN